MMLENIIYNAKIHYYGTLVDINRALYIAGLRSGDKCEELNKMYFMKVLNLAYKKYGEDKVNKFFDA